MSLTLNEAPNIHCSSFKRRRHYLQDASKTYQTWNVLYAKEPTPYGKSSSVRGVQLCHHTQGEFSTSKL